MAPDRFKNHGTEPLPAKRENLIKRLFLFIKNTLGIGVDPIVTPRNPMAQPPQPAPHWEASLPEQSIPQKYLPGYRHPIGHYVKNPGAQRRANSQ